MNKKTILVTSEKGAKMANAFYNVPEKRIKKVHDKDTINLGGKTLQFIDAPWLHWPETMFTYLVENKVLFPCDFFGAHTAQGTYDEDVEELMPFAQRYFGEIMMPFNNMGKKAMEKIKDLKIDFIAPSHGPIYHNPKKIIDAYNRWTKGETKHKVIIVYVSMWKSTEKMIKTMVETLREEGLEVSIHNLVHADIGDIAKDLVDSRGIVLGAPTVLGGMHPLAVYASYLVKALRPPLKHAVVLSSYGWGGGALRQASELLSPTNINVVGALEINGPPTNENMQKIIEIGKQLSNKIKEG
jgi:flavorubredoxin